MVDEAKKDGVPTFMPAKDVPMSVMGDPGAVPETSKSVLSATEARLMALEDRLSRLIAVFYRSGLLHDFHMDQIAGRVPQLKSDLSGDAGFVIGPADLAVGKPATQVSA